MSDAALPDRDMDILIYSHKPFLFPRQSNWLRPMIGRECQPPLPDLLTNDSGDNIGHLGDHYNELTGLYWLWKNQTRAKIVGLFHYRRYLNFLENTPGATVRPFEVTAQATENNLEFLTAPYQRARIEQLLEIFDVIVPQGVIEPISIEQQYLNAHARRPWDRFWDIVFRLYPHYAKFRPFLRLSNKFHFNNIVVSKKPWLDAYAAELFPALDILVKELGFPPPEPSKRFQERRYPAYLAERFLMFYLHANGVRAYDAQLVTLTERG